MIKNICLVDTTYALSLYLLKMTLCEIRDTLFFVGNAIPKEISSHLPHVIHIDMKDEDWTKSWKAKMIYRIKIMWKLSFIYFPWIKCYAQDHLSFSDIVIWNKKYTLIEDAPHAYKCVDSVVYLTPFEPYRGSTLKWRLKYHLVHGPIYGRKFGTNGQCINRWVTTIEDLESNYIYNKPHEYIDYIKLWTDANEEKKIYIKEVFNVSKELIDFGQGADLLICSQPLVEDCNLSEEEVVIIYGPHICKSGNVVIKPHPRDNFDYKKHFSQVYVMDTKAPMQLLNAMGMTFKKALTISSTALSALPSNTEKIYLGTKVNKKIFDVYGDLCNNV